MERACAISYTVDRDLRFQSFRGGDLLIGRYLSDLFSAEAFRKPLAAHRRALRGESVTFEILYHGRKMLVFLEPFWTTKRSVHGVAGIAFDITESTRRQAELERFRRSATDEVTGLPNRSALRAYVGHRVGANERVVSFLVVSVDRFRSTTDALGREFGDRMLRAIGDRITATLPRAYVARLENATFAVPLGSKIDPQQVSARLHEAFAEPFELDEHRLTPTISIGIAIVSGEDSADTMTRQADIAVQTAKFAGGNRTVNYDEELALLSSRRIALDRDLRRAIERDEFFLEYQPIVDEAEHVVVIEALLRWRHPVHGLVSPEEFIPIAEANGAIVPIGRWVLRSACAELRRVRESCDRPIRVAVNVSAKQFSDADLLGVIHEALAVSELDPEALEIEITESTIANDPAHANRLLSDLRKTGVTVSIDDFGTGYSSLSSLRRLPIDSLKIDRSFVATMPSDSEACAIVEVILGLAKRLSLNVIAEGVETAEQANFFKARDCTLLQGYYYGRAMSATAIGALVARARRPPSLPKFVSV